MILVLNGVNQVQLNFVIVLEVLQFSENIDECCFTKYHDLHVLLELSSYSKFKPMVHRNGFVQQFSRNIVTNMSHLIQ